MKFSKIGFLLCFCIVLFRVANAECTNNAQTIIKAVHSSSPAERLNALVMTVDFRRQLISEMISVLNEPVEFDSDWLDPNASYNVAISVLGELRAAESVQHLIKWLRPQAKQGFVYIRPIRFSAAGFALIKIGKPAVPALIKLICDEGDQISINTLSGILVEIEGKDVAVFLLQQALRGEGSPSSKQHIDAALKVLQKAEK